LFDFNKLGALKDMMQQAQTMRAEMEQKLAATMVEGSAGGGLVTVRMNGRKEVLKLKIDPANVSGSLTPSDVEMLEDLIAAAVNDASHKVDAAMKDSMQNTLNGLGIGAGAGDLLDSLNPPDRS
jgi:DNA-binding YbaB/EbfC family protein